MNRQNQQQLQIKLKNKAKPLRKHDISILLGFGIKFRKNLKLFYSAIDFVLNTGRNGCKRNKILMKIYYIRIMKIN